MTPDPRHAKTLGEAAQNPDGTFNGVRALSWLSRVLFPHWKGLSEQEVQAMLDEIKARKRDNDKET